MTQLGWIPTTDPRKMADNERYDMSRLRLGVPPMGSVEVTFPYNREWIDEQNQGNIGACVGYSCSWMKSYHDDELFNAYWLYKRAQAIDNDPAPRTITMAPICGQPATCCARKATPYTKTGVRTWNTRSCPTGGRNRWTRSAPLPPKDTRWCSAFLGSASSTARVP